MLTLPSPASPDLATAAAAQARFDSLIKPPGSLGQLEAVGARIAGIRGVVNPGLARPAVVVCAADHGVVAEGVSTVPADVTGLMVRQFISGGAAISVLARHHGVRLVVADCGVAAPLPDLGDALVDLRVRAGTANATHEHAMTENEAARAVGNGVALADRLIDEGVDLIALGEMGIGNTTTASALTAAYLDLPVSAAVGPGTGLDSAGLQRKRDVVHTMLDRHAATVGGGDPLQVLAALGGLEIATLAGVTLGAAARRVPVVLDGFIATTAALAADRLAPGCVHSMIAGHRSAEPAHTLQLEALELPPLLDLGMRLGEGTGAVLAIALIQSALDALQSMATFADLGLS